MRRLSEMFDDTWVMSQVEEELQVEEHLETLDPSAEQRILELALNKINEKPTESTDGCNKKRTCIFGRKKLLLVAALVAAFIGTVTVSAHEGGIEAVLEPVAEMMESISLKIGLKEHVHLSSNEEAENLIVENIEENEESEHTIDEHSGVKVSVEQVISDGEDAYLYLAVEIADSIIPEQWPSEDILYFRENYMQVGDGEPQRKNFVLRQEEDGSIYGIIPFSLAENEAGNVTISLSLNNLDFATGGEEDREIVRLLEGEWNLSWNLQCEKIAKTYDIHAVVDAHDDTVTLNKAVVSPLSVSVVGTIESDDPTYSQLSCFIYNIILKDGTLMDCDGSFAQYKEGSEKIMLKFHFDKMMDMDDVAGVVVNHDSIYFQ